MEQGRALWKSVLVGLATGIVMMAVLCFLAAALVNAEIIPLKAVSMLGMCLALLGVFAGCLSAARHQGGKTLVTCLVTGAGLLAAILLAKAAFFDGWSAYAAPGLAIGGGLALLSAFLPSGRKRRARRH